MKQIIVTVQAKKINFGAKWMCFGAKKMRYGPNNFVFQNILSQIALFHIVITVNFFKIIFKFSRQKFNCLIYIVCHPLCIMVFKKAKIWLKSFKNYHYGTANILPIA